MFYFLDENNGQYICEAVNIVGVGNEKFEVRAVWEFAEVDELGNYIGTRVRDTSEFPFSDPVQKKSNRIHFSNPERNQVQ